MRSAARAASAEELFPAWHGYIPTCSRAAKKSGKDAFHRVPRMACGKKWDAVERVLTHSVAALPRCVSCAFSRLVPLRVLRRCKCKCSAGSRWPKRRGCKATQSHHGGKAESRKQKAEMAGQAISCHLQVSFKPCAWEGVATYKPPPCDPQATLKPTSCDLEATDRNLVFGCPLVLDAGPVKENSFPLSFIAAPFCQTWRRASAGKFCRFSGGPSPVATRRYGKSITRLGS